MQAQGVFVCLFVCLCAFTCDNKKQQILSCHTLLCLEPRSAVARCSPDEPAGALYCAFGLVAAQ